MGKVIAVDLSFDKRKPREKEAENLIKILVKRSGGWVTKIHADEVQGKATLDLFGSFQGQPFYVDVKAPGEMASSMQGYLIKRARGSGYVSGVADSVEAFIKLFN